jgi:NADH:ubiquinone oxidoreductase subunit 6 (subunit J)
MSVGDIAVYALAFVTLAILFKLILTNWKSLLRGAGWAAVVAAVLGAGFVVLGVVAVVGVMAWQRVSDHNLVQQCLTAHERREKALAAPADYFGRKLREAADEEAERCREFAARKEAEARESK